LFRILAVGFALNHLSAQRARFLGIQKAKHRGKREQNHRSTDDRFGVVHRSSRKESDGAHVLFYAARSIDGNPIRQRSQDFALRGQPFHPIERVMGQQHRVRVKRKRRGAYLDRKKAAAKAAPVRREPPKAKAKTKKPAAPPAET
ncbi:MAG: hypothetical protein M3N12_00825, partial [Verrucomicrobiota bacterium]|nr:hypothetical protein [Verrucomicrobiota bacterium]